VNVVGDKEGNVNEEDVCFGGQFMYFRLWSCDLLYLCLSLMPDLFLVT